MNLSVSGGPAIEPFTIQVTDAVLADLRNRLQNVRWPDEPERANWDYGTNLTFMQELVGYWLDEYDWRATEARLNLLPQFRTEISGDVIHFAHLRHPEGNRLPLVLTHGWPSSFAEFELVVPLLTDEFDLVIPSLPGYIFSSPHTRRGGRKTHHRWAELMSRLGYERFGACGSDIGARVTSRLGRDYPERVVGIHLSSVDLEWPEPFPTDLSDNERNYVERTERWDKQEGGYRAVQATRPQTLGYGLNDSPVGLAAWLVEKFRAWSDSRGDLTSRFTFDDLLTNITLYWVTRTINSANRWYYESRAHPDVLQPGQRIDVPTAVAMFPGEAELLVPREFAERVYNVKQWHDMERGGHFPAMEEPSLLADDIGQFFRAHDGRTT
jgi:pimeloyl-ACP methyl ester carboxylesterase